VAEPFFKVSTVFPCSAPAGRGKGGWDPALCHFMSDCVSKFYTKVKLKKKKTGKCILWTQIMNLDTTNHHFMGQDIIKMSKNNKLAPK